MSDSLRTVLPDWHDGHIRIIDIIPAEPLTGPPCRRLPVTGGWVDITLRDGRLEIPEQEPASRHGYLEETQGEHGLPSLTIDDALFDALLPKQASLPLFLAGYHMSFLRTLMGGPWGEHPRRMCLYRMGVMFDLPATSGDASLAGMARAIAPSVSNLHDPRLIVSRLGQATLVLSRLLRLSRLNALVALSCAKVVPPPTTEPFGRAAGWESCPGGAFIDFE